MTRAFCIWCETGTGRPKPDMFWIHIKCFEEITDLQQDLNGMKRRLEAGETTEEISTFLKRMDDFNKRWEGSMKFIEVHG